MHLNVTMKNVSWPYFSWATLYNVIMHVVRSDVFRVRHRLLHLHYSD